MKRLVDGRYVVRWYVAGRGSPRRQRTFDRKRDAELFEAEVRRRRAMGDLASFGAPEPTVSGLAKDWWANRAVPNLAGQTLDKYERMLAKHVEPRLGDLRLSEVTPQRVAEFRAQLERKGVGRDSVRVSMVVLQAMFRYGGVAANPVKAVEKPSGKRERAVVCLAPGQVEAIRAELISRDKLYAAAMVSLVAYQGLRAPEELLGLEARHVGKSTLLIEQRNIDGQIVPGQKVRGLAPRAVDLLEPVRADLAEYMLALGIRRGLLFPRGDGEPWRRYDWQNWRRRVWHPARKRAKVESLPPYDLRHAFASLQIRAGMSIPELAEQMGHSPQMTVGTYTHVIRELRGEPSLGAEDQIRQAREQRQERRAS